MIGDSMKTIKDFDLNNKRVIIRVDFNVPFKSCIIIFATLVAASSCHFAFAFSFAFEMNYII